jgi:recA bacterial DNA recombination protein
MTLPKLHVALPQQLERLLPARSRGLAFGIPALDRLLPLGVPRGQITALDAPLGSGGTALLLALAETTLQSGEGVALVDAERSLAPQAAAHLAVLGQFWVIRPRGALGAWWCADVLLRTGAFALVVVDQASAPARHVAVRLQRLARDKDAALVIRRADGRTGGRAEELHADTIRPSVRLSVCPSTDGFVPAIPGPGAAWPGPRTVRVTTLKGGAPRAAEVELELALPHRLRPHWAVRDRRAGASSRSLAGRGQRVRAATPDWPERAR